MNAPIQTKDLRNMIPTYKECIRMGWLFARGYRWPIDEILDIEVCCICGKHPDLICEFTNLIPIFNGESIQHICDTHQREKGEFVWNCLTGEKNYLSPNKSVMEDIFRQLVLKIYIFFRVIYFTSSYTWGWKIMFPAQLKLRELKQWIEF